MPAGAPAASGYAGRRETTWTVIKGRGTGPASTGLTPWGTRPAPRATDWASPVTRRLRGGHGTLQWHDTRLWRDALGQRRRDARPRVLA